MKILAAAARFAFVGSHCNVDRCVPAAVTVGSLALQQHRVFRPYSPVLGSSRLYAAATGGSQQQPTIRHIGKQEMEEIIEDYEAGGREESGYVILDVREPREIEFTGKLSPGTLNLPMQALGAMNAFALDEDDFEDAFGFPKPQLDETLVFSCAAGVRSVYAAQFAAQNGYSNLINYMGGSQEWFSK